MTHEQKDGTGSRVLSTAVLCRIQKMRDENAALAKVDLMFSDGTIAVPKEMFCGQVDEYDQVISMLQRLVSDGDVAGGANR